jgi:hypothetical protein
MISSTPSPTLISFVNSHFGPIRSLNFLLESQDTNLDLQERFQILISDIWEKTMLSTRPMVMPLRMVNDLEYPPMKVKTLEEGSFIIRRNLAQGILTGDPFFFRSGIL